MMNVYYCYQTFPWNVGYGFTSMHLFNDQGMGKVDFSIGLQSYNYLYQILRLYSTIRLQNP